VTEIARTKAEMLSALYPVLRPESYVFVTLADRDRAAMLRPAAIATFEEDEGTSMIVPAERAVAGGIEASAPMRCITLTVHSDLLGAGLTAAVTGALAARGIPCNMVAAFHHDHVFVPADKVRAAMEILLALQAEAQGQT